MNAAFACQRADNRQQLAAEQAARVRLVAVSVGGVAIVQPQQPPTAVNIHQHAIHRVFNGAAVFVRRGDGHKRHVLAVAQQESVLRGQHNMVAFAGCALDVLGNQMPVRVIRARDQLARLKRHLPRRTAACPVRAADFLDTQRTPVEQQFGFHAVRHDRHINHLSRIPIPVYANVRHRRVRPQGFE